MTSADTGDVLSVTSEGVTVEKSFEPDDFPVPAIAFTIRSEREGPVSVRLIDSVPEDVSPENIGFHPKYGAEFWAVDGEGIVFERELAAGEEYTTVYGLRGDDGERPEKFLSEPTLESITPTLEEESADGADGSEGDSDEADGGEMDGDDADEDIEAVSIGPDPEDTALDLPESSEIADGDGGSLDLGDDAGASEDGVGAPAAPDDGDGRTAPASDGPLLETLADEIEAADPDDPQVAALRDALGMDLTRTTIEARIEHLQAAVSDLEAYTGALEEFLDENGDGQQVLDDVREQYDETRERLDDVEETATDANESVAELEDRVDTEFGDLEADVDGIRTDIEDLEAELESISDELSAVVEMRDRLASALGGLGGGLDDGGDGDEDGSA